ncbi:Chk1 protein kinase [Podochytrium sp. JEL0797]|nr:Chk1 protein kinase [Podochytrium sp. JEL0797]
MLSVSTSEPGVVLGFQLGEIIGEGAHSVVRIAQSQSGELVAVKIVKKKSGAQGVQVRKALEKEVLIHKSLRHPNVIQMLQSTEDEALIYIVLDFAAAGELFDHIAPDVGMGEQLAHFYFKQLVAGMADIWSVGIIFYVLMAGNTAWGDPSKHDPEFVFFLSQYGSGLNYAPWNQFGSGVLDLLIGILNTDTSKRYSLRDIAFDPWFSRSNPLLTNGQCNNPVALAELMKNQLTGGSGSPQKEEIVSYSQPQAMRDFDMDTSLPESRHPVDSFSQPVRSDMRYSPSDQMLHVPLSQDTKTNPFKDLLLSDNLTRFFSPHTPNVILDRVAEVFTQFVVPHKTIHNQLKIIFNTVDRRKCPLNGQMVLQRVSDNMYHVGFRKSKGDPIEFKR